MKVVIVGAGGHGQVVADVFLKQAEAGVPLQLVGFVDDDQALHHQAVMGIPVLGAVSCLSITDHDAIVVAVGDNRRRPELCALLNAAGETLVAAVHPSAVIGNDCDVEGGAMICAGAVVSTGSRIRYGAIILISTDKAVNPSSVMGASKRIAELVLQAQAAGSGTSFSVVRFGNVLASNGSVVPRFLEQIRKGGPLTVTHPDMRRFFMLIPEAVQLVLHAAALADSGAVYVLEMGEQVKLVDMARDLIRLSGLVPDEEISIEFTGLRPGEKMFEELVGVGEDVGPSPVEKLLRVRNRSKPDANLWASVENLEQQARQGATADVLAAMHALVPEYGAAPTLTPEQAQPEYEVSPEVLAEAHRAGDHACPHCAGMMHRSHARSLPERLRKGLSHQRLFRCDSCGWRGWLVPLEFGDHHPMEARPAPDLSSLDSVSYPIQGQPRQTFAPRNLQ